VWSAPGTRRALPAWLEFGGAATLVSYGVTPIAGTPTPERAERMRADLLAALPPSHLERLKEMPPCLRLGDYILVHAGIRPGRALDSQDPADLMWIRHEFLASRRYHGGLVVHGHHVVGEPEILPNRIGLDTGAYCTGVLSCLIAEGEDRRLMQAGPWGIRKSALPPK
jgi:serine/threonine protein phosphatase 1